MWRSLSSVLKFIWLQVSYHFKYFPKDEKKDGAIERKRDREHLKMMKGAIKYIDQIDKKMQLPIQGRANCRMYHTYSW